MPADNSDSIVVLQTSVGEDLVLRANPTDKAVRSFVEEAAKRFKSGAPGGPSGIPAYEIYNAKRYSSEWDWIQGEDGTPIKVDALLKKATSNA